MGEPRRLHDQQAGRAAQAETTTALSGLPDPAPRSARAAGSGSPDWPVVEKRRAVDTKLVKSHSTATSRAWPPSVGADAAAPTLPSDIRRSDRDGLPAAESRRRRACSHAVGITAGVATATYLAWRIGWTIPATGLWLALPLLVLEIHAAIALVLFVVSTWSVDPPAVPPVPAEPPTVAVLIATYNEDMEVLLPTVAAALALEGDHETWVLDDGDRLEVAQMAHALGARYVTRREHHHAKAGNLNHALNLVTADLIAVFDADHVPERDFLCRTIGYFTDPRVAVVQTPQEFYNTTSFEHLGRGSDVHEESLFYRVIQAGKNSANAAFWCGTNAVLRVEALRSVGGIATETLTEDLHTTLRLHRAGWRSIYHNEVLARGLAAATPREFLAQRRRWGHGAMQVIRYDNPLKPGLSWRQRIAYLYSLSAWFDCWRTLGLALVPVAVLLTGVFPVAADPEIFLFAAGATFLLQQLTLVTLGRGRTHLGWSIVFDFIRLPANLAATLSLFFPRRTDFRVTAKGRTGERRARAPLPFVLALLAAVLILGLAWAGASFAGRTPTRYSSPDVMLVSVGWVLFTLAFLVTAARRITDVRFGVERRDGHRFALSLPAQLGGMPAEVVNASLGGAQVRLFGGDYEYGQDLELTILLPDRPEPISFHTTVCGRDGATHRLRFAPRQWVQLAALAMTSFGAGRPRGAHWAFEEETLPRAGTVSRTA